jgi:hypothetical protein
VVVESNVLKPLAILRALIFARDSGFLDLVFEGDCKSMLPEENEEFEDFSPQRQFYRQKL